MTNEQLAVQEIKMMQELCMIAGRAEVVASTHLKDSGTKESTPDLEKILKAMVLIEDAIQILGVSVEGSLEGVLGS